MKTIQLIAATIVTALLTGCGDTNHPVQTATVISDSTPVETTPGSTPMQVDSVRGNAKGPDQMVPENTAPTTSVTAAPKK